MSSETWHGTQLSSPRKRRGTECGCRIAPRAFRELQFEGFIDPASDTHNVVKRQESQGTFRAEFKSGGNTDEDVADVITQRIATPLNIYKNTFIPVGLYHFVRHPLTYGSGLGRRFTCNLFECFGGYYDSALNEFGVRGNYRPTEKLSFAGIQTWNRFRLPVDNFCGFYKLADELFLQPISDFHRRDSNGHGERTSHQRQLSLALQLSSR